MESSRLRLLLTIAIALLASELRAQTPDAETRARADHVIDTSQGVEFARDQVRALLDQLKTDGDAS